MITPLRAAFLAFSLCVAASPAAAQWTRVVDLPASNVFSAWANHDTIVAGTDTSVFVSTNAGVSWQQSRKPAANVNAIVAARMRNGRLFAGTFGQGVFISDDLGQIWQGFNQGLVGGLFDSQLDLSELEVRGDSLYAATLGAGVYVRRLSGVSTWSHFGEEFELNQGSNVNSIVVGGTRLLAPAGNNGVVFFRDPGAADWTTSLLANVALIPGAQSQSAAWTGTGWVVGTTVGVFRSVGGQEPWTFSGPGLGPLDWSAFATRGSRLFAAFDRPNEVVIEHSGDDGATLQVLDHLPNAFVYKMAFSGTELYAARADGLWRRSTADVSVPSRGEVASLQFAVAGRQPVGDVVHFRFALPEPGTAAIEVFDAAGRRASERAEQSWSAGVHEMSWNARDLGPGVYEARLTANGRHEVVRLVHLR
jgi:hypothetical protein